MKRIEAFLQPDRLNKVVAALHALPRFPGFTVLIIFCEDHEANMIAELIASVAHTGPPGNGIVVISHVSKVRRIRDAGPRAGREA